MTFNEKIGYLNTQPMLLVSGDSLMTPKTGVRASMLFKDGQPSINNRGEIAVTLNCFKDMAHYNAAVDSLSLYGEGDDECPKGMIINESMVVFMSRQQLAAINFPVEHLSAKKLTFTATLNGSVDKLSVKEAVVDFSEAVAQDTRKKVAVVAKKVSLKDSTFATYQEVNATYLSMKADADATPEQIAAAEAAVKTAKAAAIAARTAA